MYYKNAAILIIIQIYSYNLISIELYKFTLYKDVIKIQTIHIYTSII